MILGNELVRTKIFANGDVTAALTQWCTECACLGEEAAKAEDPLASATRAVATLPAMLGGLGLQSALRSAPAAYWGAWADTLGYLRDRQPRLAAACVQALERSGNDRPALCAANDAANLLRSVGWHECPAWATLAHMTAQPPRAREAGPGDWPHGWHAGAWLAAVPSGTATSLPQEVMQIALRRRLRLQLPLGPGCCGQEGHGCRRRLDPWGDHALARTRTGLLARRAKLVQRTWLAVCREAVGAEGHVVPQQRLAHTSVPGVPSTDRR